MNIGDTYTAEKIIFNQLTNPTGTEQDDKQIDLLEALAFEHMDTRLASISAAQGDTCRWLFDTHEYRHWRRGFRRSHRRFLWIKGKPGAGKSTMMRLAFHEAAKDFRKSIVAGYFFNARGHGLAKSTQGMYRSLLHQIFSKLPQLPPEIPSSVAASLKKEGWSIPVLQDMLRTVILHLRHDESLVCYIDALDECAEDDIREAIHHFEELARLALTRNTKFLIFFASRHYPTITVRHDREIDLDKQTGHQQDISDYVSSTLRVSGSLGDELQRSIQDRSAGVFLWAVLTVRILNKLNDRGATRAQLRARLSEVPIKVQRLFSEILQGGDVYLLPALQWVLFAQRPLGVEELYSAILASVKAQPTGVWDETEIDSERMRRFILASSKGLLTFVKGSLSPEQRAMGLYNDREITVQLIHESLREHLLQGGLTELDSSLQGDTYAIIHARLAEACQWYVSNAKQPPELKKTRLDWYMHPLGHYATSTTLDHMYIAFTHNALPNEVLGQFARLWLTSGLIIRRSSFNGHEQYAILLCLSLAKTCQQISIDDRRRVLDALTLDDAGIAGWNIGLKSIRFVNSYSLEERKKLPLFQAAIDAASVDVLQLCRHRGWKDSFARLLPDILIAASSMGMTSVLELLLGCFGNESEHKPFGWEMLYGAALNLQESSIELLLLRGAEPSVDTVKMLAHSVEWTRPVDGSEEGRLRIMTALLDAGADITDEQFDDCDVKRPRMIELLKERGASIRYCSTFVDRSTLTCEHGFSKACRAQGKEM